MPESKEEEIIGTLWIIAALLAFGFGYSWWGWVFAIKGGTDQITAIVFAIKHRMKNEYEKRKASDTIING